MVNNRIRSIDEVLFALKTKLSHAMHVHDEACAQHTKAYLTDYEAYPYRDEAGEPILQKPSDQEIEDLISVKWPWIVRLLVPKLRDKPIVTGADIRAWANPADGGNLRRYAQKFAWHTLWKNDTAAIQVAKDRVASFHKASDAWFNMKYAQPRSFYNLEALFDVIKQLEKFSFRNKWDYESEDTVIFLDKGESEHLSQVLGDDEFKETIGFKVSLPNLKDRLDHKNSLRTVFSRFAGMHPVSNSELVNRMTAILALDPASKFRLDFAQSRGVNIHLAQLDCGEDQGPAAVIRGDDVYIFNVSEEEIGDHAMALDHELRHFWQRQALGDTFKKNRSAIDRLVEVYLCEADAYATCSSSAYMWTRKGIHIDGWDKNSGFDEQYNKAMEAFGDETKALNFLRSYTFNFLIFSGELDTKYGKRWAEQYKLSPKTLNHLSEKIALSPYLEEEFLRRLTVVGDQTYLLPEHIPFLKENIKNIGHSFHADRGPSSSAMDKLIP